MAEADDELLNAHVLVAEGRTETSESAAGILQALFAQIGLIRPCGTWGAGQ